MGFKNAAVNHNLIKEVKYQATEFQYYAAQIREVKGKQTIKVKWYNPKDGWHMLNTDDSTQWNPGLASSWGDQRSYRVVD